jgi:hypothetical protein
MIIDKTIKPVFKIPHQIFTAMLVLIVFHLPRINGQMMVSGFQLIGL